MTETTITRKDGKTLTAFVYNAHANKPAVIIIQEWWGINEQMKKRSQRFEDAGFRVILPDLYHGRSAKIGHTAEAKHLFDTLNWPEALLDVQACIDYARETGSTKVAATGYCMGGGLSFAVATKGGLDAVAPFYGIPPETSFDLSSITCPIQAHFAEIDDWCNPERVSKLKKLLKPTDEVYTYAGAHHAFTNEARPEVYHAQHTETSLDRTFVFFGQHLFN